jgi:hypothetical protein
MKNPRFSYIIRDNQAVQDIAATMAKYVPREIHTLSQLLIENKLHEQYAVLTRRLQANDIDIPDLNQSIAFFTILAKEVMAEKYGSTWVDSVGGGSRSQSITSPPVLYADVPEGGFTRAEKAAIKEIATNAGRQIPPALKENFEGVTDIEARYALSQGIAIGAKLVDPASNPALDTWMQDASDRLGVPKPRFVIMDSDLPKAFVLSLPRIPATVFVSSNLVNKLSERQLEAVIGHEMDHFQEQYHKDQQDSKPKSVSSMISGAFWDTFATQPKRKPYEREYSADTLGAKLTSPKDMEEALRIVYARQEELADFADKLKLLFKDQGIPLKELPHYVRMMTDFPHTPKLTPDKTPDKHFGDDRHDKHPPLDWRIRSLRQSTTPDGIV